jgi:hypothetical protein
VSCTSKSSAKDRLRNQSTGSAYSLNPAWNFRFLLTCTVGNRSTEDGKEAKKQTARGRNQDRARVAGGQDYEVNYESKKTRKSAGAVKKAVKKVGNSRKLVEKALKGKKR